MQYVNNFLKALNKKQNAGSLSCVVDVENIEFSRNRIENLDYPKSVQDLYTNISFVKIAKPRAFELLRFIEFELIDEKYLFFALINETQKICFDVSHINSAGEWDIIELENKFLITKTLASLLTNKVWAWVERSRNIWEEESF